MFLLDLTSNFWKVVCVCLYISNWLWSYRWQHGQTAGSVPAKTQRPGGSALSGTSHRIHSLPRGCSHGTRIRARWAFAVSVCLKPFRFKMLYWHVCLFFIFICTLKSCKCYLTFDVYYRFAEWWLSDTPSSAERCTQPFVAGVCYRWLREPELRSGPLLQGRLPDSGAALPRPGSPNSPENTIIRYVTVEEIWPILSLSPPTVFKKVASQLQHFLTFSQKIFGPQNIVLYEYLNIQYVKRKNSLLCF